MIFKDVQKYAEINWKECLKSVTECSKAKKTKISLVRNETKIYCFDDISKTIYFNDNPSASVDGVDFNEDEIVLVEYKSGFKEKITRDNYANDYRSRCPETQSVCKDYWDLFFKLRDGEKKELISNLKLKALDTYVTLEKNIFPNCDDTPKGKKLRLIIVIDADDVDDMEDALSDLSRKPTSKNNYFTKIKDALSRFKLREDAFGNKYLYDSIEVYSVKRYSDLINTY